MIYDVGQTQSHFTLLFNSNFQIMEKINGNTKKGKEKAERYWKSTSTMLRECYRNYSTSKAIAEREYAEMMLNENGWGFKIISYNTFGFSCGWLTDQGIRIETPSKSYLITY